LQLSLASLFKIKLFRYAIIGGVSTAIHLSVAYLVMYYLVNSLIISNIIGFLSAYVFSYLVQSKYVFQHAVSIIKAIKYFLVQLLSLVSAMALSYLIPMDNNYLQTLVIVVILPLVTFVIHKFWTFKS